MAVTTGPAPAVNASLIDFQVKEEIVEDTPIKEQCRCECGQFFMQVPSGEPFPIKMESSTELLRNFNNQRHCQWSPTTRLRAGLDSDHWSDSKHHCQASELQQHCQVSESHCQDLRKACHAIPQIKLKSQSAEDLDDYKSGSAGAGALLGNRQLIVLLERLQMDENGKPIIYTYTQKNICKRRATLKQMKALECKVIKGSHAEFAPSKKGYPQLHLDGYVYNKKAEGKQGRTIYWKCIEQRCRTWVKQEGNNFITPVKHDSSACLPFQPRIPKPRRRVVYPCSFCDKSVNKKSTWVVHERTHTGEKPYACEHCTHSFASPSGLISHSRTHTQERHYKCIHCSYQALTSSNLKSHVTKNHTARGRVPKFYGCEFCLKAFAAKKLLVDHQKRVHGDKKPYKCPTCSKAFLLSTGLSVHCRMHEAINPFMWRRNSQ